MGITSLPAFALDVPQAELDDLRRRLESTRWPVQAAGRAWQYGADLDYLKRVHDQWLHRHDWRAWEARLNRFCQYRTPVGGKPLHFIVERGSGANPLPLVLLHGWPGSMFEFLDVIDKLAHPERYGGQEADAFDVVVPSLPGFGFSDPMADVPVHPTVLARSISALMVDVLGYDRYVLQGGDWGAIIGSWVALDHPAGLAAIHHNSQGLGGGHSMPPAPGESALTPREVQWLADNEAFRKGHFGYWDVQGSEPQTLAYALTDSPMGLAAWIIQRFHSWTVRGSVEPPPFDVDHLIANVMMYWLAGINVPNWLYVSLVDGSARRIPAGRKIDVPAGFLFGPRDNVIAPPIEWLQRAFRDVRRCEIAQRGGHFLAFEQPDLFVTEVRDFFRACR